MTCDVRERMPWREIRPFQGNLKVITERNMMKLKARLARGIDLPIFVWRRNGKAYCLDGHQRLKAFAEMESEGWEIPLVPVVSVEAFSRREAKEKILEMVSQYGVVSEPELRRFIADEGLDLGMLMEEMQIPYLELERMKAWDPASVPADKDLGEFDLKNRCPRCGYEF